MNEADKKFIILGHLLRKAFDIIPKFETTPGKVWRGAPSLGQDNEVILTKLLGYTEEQVQILKAKGLI